MLVDHGFATWDGGGCRRPNCDFKVTSNGMWPGCAMNVDSVRQPSFNGDPRFATSCSGSSATIDHSAALEPSDLDAYFVTEGARRWSRVSTSGIAAALRVFLRYMASCGECDPRVAEAHPGTASVCTGVTAVRSGVVGRPPTSGACRRGFAGGRPRSRDLDAPCHLRNAQRRGQIVAPRPDRSGPGVYVRVFRLKRRQPQVYPLLQSVAEAVARYIDTARPKSAHPEIFLGLLAPHGPLSSGAMSALVRHRFMALGIQALHRGPHALRHACAARLVAEGLTMKEIGDHLGHRTTRATGTYAKIDLLALREVGDFDLGDLE